MKFIWIFFACVFFCTTFGVSAQVTERGMTFDELYALADTQSRSVKIFEAAVEGAAQDVSVARNDRLSSVDFSASASYNGNAWVADRDFSNGQNFATLHFGNDFSVEASPVVFAGGSIHNHIRALDLQKQIPEWDLAEPRLRIPERNSNQLLYS